MNKKINQMSQYIRSGKLLEENIPQLFNQLADHYDTFAGIQLAMHYYSFYESYCDEESTWSTEAKAMILTINNIIKENIITIHSGAEREKSICAIDEIRKEISKRMNYLTAYTDIFQTYEYILNRLEYRYKDELKPVDEEEFAKEILRYIFDTEDNFIINEKIKDMIGQLPIRITKQRYFDLLKESIHAYLGAEQSTLTMYLYMIRTSAMIYREEGMDTCYPMLWDKKEALSGMEYNEILREDYEKAVSILREATLILETETTIYFSLQEIVNKVYALLLCSPYAGMVTSGMDLVKNSAVSIMKEVNEAFCKEQKSELSMDLIQKFSEIEGVQELLFEEIAVMEDALYDVGKNNKTFVQSLMLENLFQVLEASQKLLSSSLFINLEDEKDEISIVDEEVINKEAKALEEELTNFFASHSKIISRAVIANTMNKMPVFFKDHKEVMDYVLYSFERCSDKFEKAACIEIINSIMSE